MAIGSITVAQLESKKLCTPRRVQVGLLVTRQELELTVDSHTDRSNSEQLATLHQAMMANVVTYLGGLPGEACFFSLIWLFLQASLHSALPVLGKAYNYKKKKGFFSPQVPLVSSSHFSFGGSQLFNSSIIQTLRHGSLSLSLWFEFGNVLIFELGALCTFLKCHHLAQLRNCIKNVRKANICK